MATTLLEKSDSDTAWKEVLDVTLKDFIAYCFPNLYELINWPKGWVSLDKELHAIVKVGMSGKRLVDKLVKVFLRNGFEQWILIHVEVQGRPDDDFPQRMFTYAYRIFDKYQQPIFSCAILTDKSRDWRPSCFEVGIAGSRIRSDYLVVKLLDYQSQLAELEKESNPFASVILTQLHALAIQNKPADERARMKYHLTKRLYGKGYSKEHIKNLYYFIDWLIGLPRHYELEYQQNVYALEELDKMAYVSSAEKFGMERGLALGIAQGESRVILKQLQLKFGIIEQQYLDLIAQADADRLLLLGERVLTAETLQEVFRE